MAAKVQAVFRHHEDVIYRAENNVHRGIDGWGVRAEFYDDWAGIVRMMVYHPAVSSEADVQAVVTRLESA